MTLTDQIEEILKSTVAHETRMVLIDNAVRRARAQLEPEALRLLRRLHARVAFTIGSGYGDICARCQEAWPCKTAVIMGIDKPEENDWTEADDAS